MQDVHIVSKSKFPTLSNGALVVAVTLILIMYRKIDKTIHASCACIQPEFSAYWTQFTGKANAPFKRA
jgi:hypothetical protein